MYDVAIVGAGITGSSIAFELAKYKLKVCLIEKENDVALATTKANSGIVHAGYDPKPGTLMARLNVEGNKIYHQLAKKLNIHFVNNGSLVLAFSEKERKIVEDLYKRGIENKVPQLSIINKKEILKLEPNISDKVVCALYAKTAGVVAPWEMGLAMAQTAVKNGVELLLNSQVQNIKFEKGRFEIIAGSKKIFSKYLINAAGLFADEIYKLVLDKNKSKSFQILPSKGEYYLLDKSQGNLVSRTLFQCPSENGKGVLVSRTCHGNLIVGPNAVVSKKDDVSNTTEGMSYIKNTAFKTTEKINYRDNIRNFSGLRASIPDYDDFLIEESPYVKGFINFAGIKSPGLTAAPAFGGEAKKILKKCGLKFEKKSKFEFVPLKKFFNEYSPKELNALIKKNKKYGRIICRCETVSEGQIVDAIHGLIPATTIDAIKRRTNAGMGRCQGGFCGPKILEILKRELKLEPMEIYQDKNGSYLITEKSKGEK